MTLLELAAWEPKVAEFRIEYYKKDPRFEISHVGTVLWMSAYTTVSCPSSVA